MGGEEKRVDGRRGVRVSENGVKVCGAVGDGVELFDGVEGREGLPANERVVCMNFDGGLLDILAKKTTWENHADDVNSNLDSMRRSVTYS